MRRLIVGLVLTMVATTARAQIQLPGVSRQLSDMVMENKILYSDAIDITRAMNGIDISQRGNNFGNLSEPGKRVLRQMMAERDKAAAPAPAVRGKAARAKAKAKERSKSKAFEADPMDMAELIAAYESQTELTKKMGIGVDVLPLESLERIRARVERSYQDELAFKTDIRELSAASARLKQELKKLLERMDQAIAKKQAQKPTP